MEGTPWVEAITRPLWKYNLLSGAYNRIYEAVMRGDERQGKALVDAVVRIIEQGREAQHPKPL